MCALMRHTRRYALLQKIDVVIVAGTVVFLLASLSPGGVAQLLVAFGLVGALGPVGNGASYPHAIFLQTGFFIVPLLPVTYENAAEVTFPTPEDTSGAVLSIAASIAGIIYIFVMPPLLDFAMSSSCTTPLSPFAAFVLVNMLIAVALLLAFRFDQRRQAAEAMVEASRTVKDCADAAAVTASEPMAVEGIYTVTPE